MNKIIRYGILGQKLGYDKYYIIKVVVNSITVIGRKLKLLDVRTNLRTRLNWWGKKKDDFYNLIFQFLFTLVGLGDYLLLPTIPISNKS
jgi:hypothetical protein